MARARTLRSLASALTVLFVAPAMGQASRPATTDVSPATEIQRRVLLASLSAYSPRTRQEAQEKLKLLGQSVEAGLAHAAATAQDADARDRAQRVLDEIRSQRRLRDLMEPTRVTLHFDRAPARQVLASLYVRAGAQFRVFPPDPWESAGDAPVTVHLDDVPFWEAVAKLEEVTGLTLIDAGWGATFARLPPGVPRGRVSVHGPYRVVADDDAMAVGVRSLKVFLEPKVRVVWHARQAKLAGAAAGDDGRDTRKTAALAWQADRWADSRVIGKSDDVLEVEMPLAGVMRPGGHVKGTIPALLAAREEVIEDLQATLSGFATIAGRQVTWSLYGPKTDVHVLQLDPQWRPFGTPVQPQPLALGRELPAVRPTLYDARGTPLLRDPTVRVMSHGSYEWRFHQRRPQDTGAEPPCGKPVRMKWAFPTMAREIAIPFEFGQPPGRAR